MKRTLWCGALFLAVLAMLLPVIGSGNNLIGQPAPDAQWLRADGPPLPPTPPLTAVNFLAADGPPLPPTPPRTIVRKLTLDGPPLPPTPPRETAGGLAA